MYYRRILSAAVLILLSSSLWAQIPFVLTPRDTGVDPEPVVADLEIYDAYQLLTETEILKVYFRDDRDVLAIEDKRNGYVWKTGLDIPFNRDIDDAVDEGADPVVPKEARLNTTYTGIANSLVSIEYYDGANNIKRIGSAAYSDSVSSLRLIQGLPFQAELDVVFEDAEIGFIVNIQIIDDTLILGVKDDSLKGDGLSRLAYINFAPFMGASGGKQLFWDPEEEDYSVSVDKLAPEGYALVPDGSGALIRFRDNGTKLSEYIGDVYGTDKSQLGVLIDYDDFSAEAKNTSVPLFGIVHGSQQNALAVFASEASEYLQVVSFPEEHTTFYNQTYGRFVYNNLYYQVYNRNGDGYFRTLEERNRFDAELRINFLVNEDADYAGIARRYRTFLETGGILPLGSIEKDENIGIRIDFLMADVRENIIGKKHEITTRYEDIRAIIEDLQGGGIENISIGIISAESGGTISYDPGKVRLLNGLGGRREFKELVQWLQEQQMDVSLNKQYSLFAEGQLLPWGNAIRGASGWYLTRRTFLANAPVNNFYFTRPQVGLKWLEQDSSRLEKLGLQSLTIDGISSQLNSDFSGQGYTSVTEVIELYEGFFQELSQEKDLNFKNPNQYLWKYTTRYLDIPVFSTQYLLQTDTVPMLQMILNGKMELYARYSNFSFYSTNDILRMIDYNVYPSFLLTQESAHLLLATNSSDIYSSEYRVYKDRIFEVYGRVNEVLKHVIGVQWLDRKVLAPGVVRNQYDNGIEVIINYTKNIYVYDGQEIEPESASLLYDDGEDDS
jgi:hypothetical protein